MDSSHFNLHPSRIDIWQYSLRHPVMGSWDLLSEEERQRANRFYFAKHKQRFTLARATLRTVLGLYLKRPPKALDFAYNPYGKPSVVNSQGLEFNLSHSGEIALLAVGQQFPVGVDVELFSARPYTGIGKHMFSAQENAALRHVPSRLKPLSFFHIWSQKEAFIKACGQGLSYPTQQFTVSTVPAKNLPLVDPVHHTTWKLLSFMPQVASCAALCYCPDVQEVHFGLFDHTQNHTLMLKKS